MEQIRTESLSPQKPSNIRHSSRQSSFVIPPPNKNEETRLSGLQDYNYETKTTASFKSKSLAKTDELLKPVLPRIRASIPTKTESGVTMEKRRNTVSSYSHPETVTGLHRPLSGRAFVSQLPVKGLQTSNIDWIFPAKDYAPKKHKAKIIVWSDLTYQNMSILDKTQSIDGIKKVLAEIFTLDNYRDNLKLGIVMDLYFNTIMFARKLSFTPEKTSTFFSIVKKTFETCTETPFDNFDLTFTYFKDLVLAHSVNRPPWTIEIFTPMDAKDITEYVVKTFFRCYKMYKYAFTPIVKLDLTLKYNNMPPTPPQSESSIVVPDVDNHESGEDQEEDDEDRLTAKEQLRSIVKGFLLTESKKIEGSVTNHMKSVVNALQAKIDHLTKPPSK